MDHSPQKRAAHESPTPPPPRSVGRSPTPPRARRAGGRAGGAKLDSIRALTAMPGGWNFVFPPAVVVAANTSDATGRELEVCVTRDSRDRGQRHSVVAQKKDGQTMDLGGGVSSPPPLRLWIWAAASLLLPHSD